MSSLLATFSMMVSVTKEGTVSVVMTALAKASVLVQTCLMIHPILSMSGPASQTYPNWQTFFCAEFILC